MQDKFRFLRTWTQDLDILVQNSVTFGDNIIGGLGQKSGMDSWEN